MPPTFLTNVGVINTVLIMFLTVGGFLAFRNGRRAELTKFQRETIEAMQQRIDTIEGKLIDLQTENALQRHIIDTITLALKARGMVVTIDGDMVTINEPTGSSTHRKRATTTTTTVAKAIKKEENV